MRPLYLLLVVALTLAACGSGSGESAGPGDTGDPTDASVPFVATDSVPGGSEEDSVPGTTPPSGPDSGTTGTTGVTGGETTDGVVPPSPGVLSTERPDELLEEPRGPRADDFSACVDAGGDCSSIQLSGVEWPGAPLTDIDLSFSDIDGADLRSAMGVQTVAAGANLAGSNLAYANFSGANLSGADLTDAILLGTDFSGADLVGTDLTGAMTDEATNFDGVLWCETVMPDGQVRYDDCPDQDPDA